MFRQNSLCFDKISKFPVFSLRIFFGHFPCFPCTVGTLYKEGRPGRGERPNLRPEKTASGAGTDLPHLSGCLTLTDFFILQIVSVGFYGTRLTPELNLGVY